MSRLIQRGWSGLYLSAWPNSTAPISAQPSGRPRCPDCEACTASMHNPRAWFAAFESISMFRLMKLYKQTAVEFKMSKFTLVLFCGINGTLNR